MKLKSTYLSSTFAAIILLILPCKAKHTLADSHIKGWVLVGKNTKAYQSGIDKNIKYSGSASAFLSCNIKTTNNWANLMQTIKADAYKGKRIRLSAWVKTANKGNLAILWVGINNARSTETPGTNKFIPWNSDWKQYSLVLDVDTSGAFIEFGIMLHDTGKAWIDDVKMEIVDKSIPLTKDINKERQTTSNLSFENCTSATNMPDGWVGTNTLYYEIASDHSVFHDGSASVSMQSLGEKVKPRYRLGSITGLMPPDTFKGKRVRMSGWLKTENVTKNAGLWMSVAGKNWGQVLASDYMWKRPIKGTADWKKYEIVLDVPSDATIIYFGAMLGGTGKLWLDEIKFEVVGNDIASTSNYTNKGKSFSTRKMQKYARKRAENAHDSAVNLDFEG